MPLTKDGVYIETDDRGYEAEATYYLSFHILSALFSIKKLLCGENRTEGFENEVQYYHYYVDHLLFSVGQIHNRFFSGHKSKREDNRLREQNEINYAFSPEKYPVLSDKNARNTVEHIEEYNRLIIAEHYGVGGFNCIMEGMSPDARKAIEGRRETHPYTLDLIHKTLYVVRKGDAIQIDLMELREELECLNESVKSFYNIMHVF